MLRTGGAFSSHQIVYFYSSTYSTTSMASSTMPRCMPLGGVSYSLVVNLSTHAHPSTARYHEGLGLESTSGRHYARCITYRFTGGHMKSFILPIQHILLSVLYDAQMQAQQWCFAFARCSSVRARTSFHCPPLSRPRARFNERASSDTKPLYT